MLKYALVLCLISLVKCQNSNSQNKVQQSSGSEPFAYGQGQGSAQAASPYGQSQGNAQAASPYGQSQGNAQAASPYAPQAPNPYAQAFGGQGMLQGGGAGGFYQNQFGGGYPDMRQTIENRRFLSGYGVAVGPPVLGPPVLGPPVMGPPVMGPPVYGPPVYSAPYGYYRKK